MPIRPLSAIVELSATTGSISRDVSPAPSFKDEDQEDLQSPNCPLGGVGKNHQVTSTPLPARPDSSDSSGLYSEVARPLSGANQLPAVIPARSSMIMQRNPPLPRLLPLAIPIPDPFASPASPPSAWDPPGGATQQNNPASSLVTTPPPDEEHPSDVDLPKKSSGSRPGTGFASSHLGGATLALSDQGTPSGGCDAASIRSASTGGVMTSSVTRGRVPTRYRKQSPYQSIPYRPQHSIFETTPNTAVGGTLFPAGGSQPLHSFPSPSGGSGFNNRVQSPTPSFSIYESTTGSLPNGNHGNHPPPAYTRYNSNGSTSRSMPPMTSPWQRSNSVQGGYRPVPSGGANHLGNHTYSFPNNQHKQTSHLQEYPIDKKGASCRKLFTGILFMVYVALCLFLVIFVIGGPELGVFERGFQSSLVSSSTILHPSASGYVIYMLMHVWNLIWIIWALGVTCQSSQRKTGGCFRAIPPVMTCTFLCELTFGLLAQGLWLFSWDLNITYAAIWLLVLQFACFLLALAVLSSNIVQYCYLLETIFYREYCFIKVCCQNGIAGLLALSVVELLLSLNQSMTNGDIYYLQADVSASLVLTLIAITLLVYLILDVFIFEQATRFVISPYLCVTWLQCAVLLSRKPEMTERNMIILGGIVFLSAMLAGVKVIISIICHRKYASRLPGVAAPYALQMTSPNHVTSDNM